MEFALGCRGVVLTISPPYYGRGFRPLFPRLAIGITHLRPCRLDRSRICVALCLSGKCFANPYPSTLKTALTSNLAVDQRFANGTQGRLLQWHPGACESKRKALPAYCPDLLARFCKETSLSKQEMLPDVGKRFFWPYTSPHFLAKKHNALRSHGHRCEAGEFGRTRRANHVAGVCLLLFAPVGGWFRRGPCGIRVFETGSSSAWFRRMR